MNVSSESPTNNEKAIERVICRAVLELYLVYDCGMQELTIILDRSGVRPEM